MFPHNLGIVGPYYNFFDVRALNGPRLLCWSFWISPDDSGLGTIKAYKTLMRIAESAVFQELCAFYSYQLIHAALMRPLLVSHGIDPAEELLLDVNLGFKLLPNNPIINVAEHLVICKLFKVALIRLDEILFRKLK